jgi:hypothetical protein
MNVKKWLSILVLAGTFLVSLQHTGQAASQAEPQDPSGFVCNVSWFSPEQNSAGGRFGFLTGNLFTEPFCQGDRISLFSLYSTGQTLDPMNHAFTERQLMHMFQILQSQIKDGQRINMSSIGTTAGDFRGVSSVGVQHHGD